MNLQKLSEKLYMQLLEQIEETTNIESPIEKLRAGLIPVQKALAQLKLEMTKTGFSRPQEEIYFFKKGKPQIYSWLIFITERFAIENSMPVIGKDQQLAHLNAQLAFINRFFRQNEFLYQYYRLNATDLDTQYFTRDSGIQMVGFAEVPDIEPTFSTIADYLFSKFIAYEKLQDYLLNEIQTFSFQQGDLVKTNTKTLAWTGEGVNIVELVYGIFETGQINDGKASLSEIMEYFGQVFHINLSKYFKRFSDIKARKSMSKTRFLDEMTQKVTKRIEDSDAWIPEDQKRRYGY